MTCHSGETLTDVVCDRKNTGSVSRYGSVTYFIISQRVDAIYEHDGMVGCGGREGEWFGVYKSDTSTHTTYTPVDMLALRASHRQCVDSSPSIVTLALWYQYHYGMLR